MTKRKIKFIKPYAYAFLNFNYGQKRDESEDKATSNLLESPTKKHAAENDENTPKRIPKNIASPIKTSSAKLKDFFTPAGKRKDTDGIYFFNEFAKGAHGFISPQKEKVIQSQESIDGVSTLQLIESIEKNGWLINEKGQFENPINVVEFPDGKIYTYDHRRFEAAKENMTHIPFIFHKSTDRAHSRKNWGQLIKERIKDKRNSVHFKLTFGSTKSPQYRFKNKATKSQHSHKQPETSTLLKIR